MNKDPKNSRTRLLLALLLIGTLTFLFPYQALAQNTTPESGNSDDRGPGAAPSSAQGTGTAAAAKSAGTGGTSGLSSTALTGIVAAVVLVGGIVAMAGGGGGDGGGTTPSHTTPAHH